MIYIKALNIFLAVVGTFTFLWGLVAVIRDTIVFTNFEKFIGANNALEELSKEENKKVTTAIIVGAITSVLYSLLAIY